MISAEVLAVGEVAGRGEEHLAVAQPVGRRVDERLVRHPRPVVAGPEELLDQPEDVEERVERVVAIQLGRVVDRQGPSGLAGQLDDGRGPHRPLDMTVQLHLGDPVEHVAGVGDHRASCSSDDAPTATRASRSTHGLAARPPIRSRLDQIPTVRAVTVELSPRARRGAPRRGLMSVDRGIDLLLRPPDGPWREWRAPGFALLPRGGRMAVQSPFRADCSHVAGVWRPAPN